MKEESEFITLPAQGSQGDVLARREEIAGARPNGPTGQSIVYLRSGPSLYVGLTVAQLVERLNA
jgi:hypothetical protein